MWHTEICLTVNYYQQTFEYVQVVFAELAVISRDTANAVMTLQSALWYTTNHVWSTTRMNCHSDASFKLHSFYSVCSAVT